MESVVVWTNPTSSYTRYQVALGGCTFSPARECYLYSKIAAKKQFTTQVGTSGQAGSTTTVLLRYYHVRCLSSRNPFQSSKEGLVTILEEVGGGGEEEVGGEEGGRT